MWIINLTEGAGSCSCYNPPILLFLEKELPQNRKKPAFELNQKQVSFVEGTVEIDILDGRNRCRRTAKRPFWAAARVRRTSVLAVGQNLGAGVAPPPRALKSRRVEPPCGGGTHKKGHLLLMVPIGTFFEPGELSGTEADGGSRPPLCFHANNRMISSFPVICFAMCGAWSPSRMGVSSAPMSRYTIRTL